MKSLLRTGFFALFLLLMACSPGKRLAKTQSSATGAAGFSDLHNSSLYRMFVLHDPAGLDSDQFPVNLIGLKAAETRFIVLSIGIPRFSMESKEEISIQQVASFLRKFREYTAQQSPELVYVDAEDELRAALAAEKIGYTFALEGSWLMKGEVNWLDTLYNAGVRILQPGHRFDNEFFTPYASGFRWGRSCGCTY